MGIMRKLIALIVLIALLSSAFLVYWVRDPLIAKNDQPVEFTIASGSGLRSAMKQLHAQGIPAHPLLMEFLARGMGKGAMIKPGSYRIEPGTTPIALLDQLVKGNTIKESLTII